MPRGTAVLATAAGLCAAALVWTRRPSLAHLRDPARLFAALLLLGSVSALWSIVPERSLLLDLRLAGMFAAALALAAAAGAVAAPGRLALCFLGGAVLAIALAVGDIASHGGLNHFVTVRDFRAVRFNQLAAALATFALPAAALLMCRRHRLAAAAAVAAMAVTVWSLEGTAAKTILVLSLPAATAIYIWRRPAIRIAAALSVLAVVTAPLTFPRLEGLPALVRAADSYKDSAGHRLLIWSFVGDRIAERPFFGWGLDASRAIPGGQEEILPARRWLPLHPHNAALQAWLELGAGGAALLALIVAALWMGLGRVSWPPLYVAAAGGSLAGTLVGSFGAYGLWQEWWLGAFALELFVILVMARAAGPPQE